MTTTYSPQRCAELLALREKATPGPWKSGLCTTCEFPQWAIYKEVNQGHKMIAKTGSKSAEAFCDAAYIASIHDLHDQLLALQEIARRQRETLANALDALQVATTPLKSDRYIVSNAILAVRQAMKLLPDGV